MAIKVKLLAHTPNPDAVVAAAAKLCYSKVGVEQISEKLTDEEVKRFVNHLVEMGHESPIEHVTFTFGIEGISRSCSHQIVRHRIASYCLSGDTVIGYDNKSKGLTIKELYEKPKQYQDMTKIRSINEDSQEILLNNIVSVIHAGEKEVYEVLIYNLFYH